MVPAYFRNYSEKVHALQWFLMVFGQIFGVTILVKSRKYARNMKLDSWKVITV